MVWPLLRMESGWVAGCVSAGVTGRAAGCGVAAAGAVSCMGSPLNRVLTKFPTPRTAGANTSAVSTAKAGIMAAIPRAPRATACA